MNEQQKIGALESMLFAHADPVEAARLADALRVEPEEVVRLLKKLQRKLDEEESGMAILYFDPDRWQMATRPYYGEMVKRILDTRRNAPLSPAALEVLSVIAYNQPVSRSFIEQVRGVDSSSIVAKLLEKGLIEEAGRLDLPGKPIAFQVTDSFLRVFGLGSLADLPPLHGEAGDNEPSEAESDPAIDTAEDGEHLEWIAHDRCAHRAAGGAQIRWLAASFSVGAAGSPADFAGGAAVCLSGWQTIADRLVRPAAFYALATGRCQRYGGTASRRAAASARSTTKR